MDFWAYDGYLFDIDGTLMNCTDAVHYFAFCEALSGVAGRPVNLDGVVAQGNTDVGILRDAWRLAGVAEPVWRPQLDAVRAGMCAFVAARVEELQCAVLPGVVLLLTELKRRGKILGVATGNLEGIGRAKLDRAGLLQHFDFGGYSDAYEYRRDVFAGAVVKAKALIGDDARLCVIGDTPEDVRAAKANKLDVVAVATGIFTAAELAAEQPTRLVTTLEDLMR